MEEQILAVDLSTEQTLEVNLPEQDNIAQIDVYWQDEVVLDLDASLMYIVSGQQEIQDYVDNKSKPEIDEYIQDYAKPIVSEVVDQIATPVIDEYFENTVKPSIKEFAEEEMAGYAATATEQAEIATEKANEASETAKIVDEKVQEFSHTTEASKTEFVNLAQEKTEEFEQTAITATEQAVGSAERSRIWAEGEQAEVQELGGELSSMGAADLAYAIANAPEDTPINSSGLIAMNVVKGPKGDKGDKGDKGEKGEKGATGGISVQELEEALDTKQDKGNYALIEDVPTLVSQLDNDSGYTTQLDVMQAIASIPQFKLQIVDSLSRDDAEPMVLYLVPKGGSAPDVYDEYIWLEETGNFEFLGTTAVDLTGYVKNTDYATTAKAGVIKAYTQNGFGVNYLGQPFSQTVTLASYKGYGGNFFIGKGTLENIKYDFVKDGIVNNNFSLGEADRLKVRNWIGASAEAIQKDSFSTWPADRNIDKIYQYIGETTEEYVNGYFYRSVAGESTYVTADPRNLTFDYDLFWSELENAGITLETLRLTERDKTRGGFSIIGTSESETNYRVTNINGIDINVLLTQSVQSSQNIVGTSTRWYYTYTTIYEWKPIEVQPSAKTVPITQADYDALATKDANTLYLIEE